MRMYELLQISAVDGGRAAGIADNGCIDHVDRVAETLGLLRRSAHCVVTAGKYSRGGTA
jgi:hypothetical protein